MVPKPDTAPKPAPSPPASSPPLRGQSGGLESHLEQQLEVNNPSFNSELSRLLTFPDSLPWPERRQMAKRGFFWEAGRARCNFCSDVSGEHEGRCGLASGRTDNVPLGDHVANFRREDHRLLSFLEAGWTQESSDGFPVGCRELSRWGFCYAGPPDVARCAFCRLEVRGWQRGDTAEGEHRRWSPRCAFLQGREVGNVRLGEEGEEGGLVWNHQGRIRRSAEDGAGLIAGSELLPRHAHFASPEARLLSFATWPLGLAQRPPQLVEAGFFYRGVGDRVICHHCGGGLKDFGAGDDPWTEHAAWHPRCAFLALNKGESFVRRVQEATRRGRQPSEPAAAVTSQAGLPSEAKQAVTSQAGLPSEAKQAVTSQAGHPSEAKQRADSQDRVDSTRLCKVCLDRELGVVFLPCGHLTTCLDCAPQLTSCPVCRAKIAAHVRAFFA